MTIDIKVPDIGDFSDVPVINILVAVGDVIAEEDPIVELESDKATMEVPASAGGKVLEIKVAEGDSVSEGAVLMVVEGDAGAPAAAAPASPAEQAMAELRRNIEENSDYVGSDFAREARAMHEGEAPERSIFGEAKLAEAKSLVDDGIPVTPLPFMSPRKTN